MSEITVAYNSSLQRESDEEKRILSSQPTTIERTTFLSMSPHFVWPQTALKYLWQ